MAILKPQEERSRLDQQALDASIYGNEKDLRDLLRSGASHQARGVAGRQALHEAARSKSLGCVVALLEAGADPNALANGGASALCAAIQFSGHEAERIAFALLDARADANGRDSDGLGALYWAACRGSTRLLEALLERGANANDQPEMAGQGGRRALEPLRALGLERWGEGEQILRVEALLKAGADPIARYGDQSHAQWARENGMSTAAIARFESAERVARESAALEGALEKGLAKKRPGL